MVEQTLAGKVAVISGSSSGIGAAIAKELSSRGASIAINYPFPDAKLQADAEKVLSSLSTPCMAIEADLSTPTGPQKLIDEAVAKFGKIDILINNAALAVNASISSLSLQNWDTMVDLNGRGVFLLTQAAVSHFKGKNCRIVNIGSISARAAPPLQTIYAGSKGMIDSFTRVWAKELPRQYGCTVNQVSPGPTMTEGFAAAGEEFMKQMQPVMDQTPVESRLGKPEEVAFAVAFFCEERAGWINGVNVNVCGGLHID